MHDRHQGDLPRLASLLQAPMEVWVNAFLPDHGQGRHVQRVAHGGPTAPDGPRAAFVATVPRPGCEPHPRRRSPDRHATLPSRGPRSGPASRAGWRCPAAGRPTWPSPSPASAPAAGRYPGRECSDPGTAQGKVTGDAMRSRPHPSAFQERVPRQLP